MPRRSFALGSLGARGAESAPRLVRQGFAPTLEALCIAPAQITVRRETSREVGRRVRCQALTSYTNAGPCGFMSDGLGGLFCTGLPTKVGVQGQVFVVVNDDLDGDGVSDSDGAYEHPRLIEGMINEDSADIAKYIGSSTGTSHNQEICSPYRVSWHVDRACNMVSAKTLDNMCKVMKEVLVGPCRNQISRRDACSMAHPTHWLISTQDGHEEGPLPARLPRARRPQVGHGQADDAQAPRLGLDAHAHVFACGDDAARGPPLMFCAPSFPFLSPLARR